MIYSRLIIDGNAVYEIDDECEKMQNSSGEQKGRSQIPGRSHGLGGSEERKTAE